MPDFDDLIMAGRILLAALLSGVVGFERAKRNKPAGLRTHMLVGMGACAFTLSSIYGFEQGDRNSVTDPSRVAAQVVVGVGFLGAGAIATAGRRIQGLTTAASIWVVAAIGTLVAVGTAWPAVFLALSAAAALRLLPVLPARYYERGRGDRQERDTFM